MNNRRTKARIYLGILRSVRRANGVMKKTHIVYKANLTNTRVQPYLDFLLSNGLLLEERSGKNIYYRLTKKGSDLLSEANKLKEISDAFGLPLY